MIAHLRGAVSKLKPGMAEIDVHGVGYRVITPMGTWDELRNGEEHALSISTYVREDRFDLYGFIDRASRDLFESFIELQGIGPRLGLELTDVPRGLLLQAMHEEDPKLLSTIKGVGKKTAEKLLIELKSLAERQPDIFASASMPSGSGGNRFDRDAVAALTQLGYAMNDIMDALEDLPKDLSSTEERVAAALRSL